MSKKQWFEWTATVKVRVHRSWVEDGFELTKERLEDALENSILTHAYGHERSFKAKITSKPDRKEIRDAQAS